MGKEIYLTKEELIDFRNEVIKLSSKTLKDDDLEEICGGVGKSSKVTSVLMAFSFLLPISSASGKTLSESKQSSFVDYNFLNFKDNLKEKLSKNKKIAVTTKLLTIAGITVIVIACVVKLRQAKSKEQFLSILKEGFENAKSKDDFMMLVDEVGKILASKTSTENLSELNKLTGFMTCCIDKESGISGQEIFEEIKNFIEKFDIKFSPEDKQPLDDLKSYKKQFLFVLKKGFETAKSKDDLLILLDKMEKISVSNSSKLSSNTPEHRRFSYHIKYLYSCIKDGAIKNKEELFERIEKLIDAFEIEFDSEDVNNLYLAFKTMDSTPVNTKKPVNTEKDNNIVVYDIEQIKNDFESISKEIPPLIFPQNDRDDEKCIAAYVKSGYGADLKTQFPHAKSKLVEFYKIVEKYNFTSHTTEKIKEAENINDINDACKFVAELKEVWEPFLREGAFNDSLEHPINDMVNYDSPILKNPELKALFSEIINHFFDYFNDCKLVTEKGPALYEKQKKEEEQKRAETSGEVENKTKSLSTSLKQPKTEKNFFTKAWVAEDPQDVIYNDPYFEQGHKITDTQVINSINSWTNHFKEFAFGFTPNGMYNGVRGILSMVGFNTKMVYPLNDSFFKQVCEDNKYKSECVTSICIPSFRDATTFLEQINFPHLNEVKFSNYDNIAMSPNVFSNCPNLKIVRFEGGGNIDLVNGDTFNTKASPGIDLFSACKHSVTIVCKTKEQAANFKKILGAEGRRHKVYTSNEFLKFGAIYCRDTTLLNKEIPSKITAPIIENLFYKLPYNAQTSLGIPKNIKVIETNAFKNIHIHGVIFEEGMTELELCDECFAGCDLVKFELPKSLRKLTVGKNCFKDCEHANAIEQYVRSVQKRLEKEERERKEREAEEEKQRKEAEERDRKAKELQKWKEDTQEQIEAKKNTIQEEIKALEEKLNEFSVIQKVRETDLNEKNNEDISEKNEMELKLFNIEKNYFKAKLDVAKKDVELVNVKLAANRDLLRSCNEQIEILKNAEEINLFFIDSIRESQKAQHDRREAEMKLNEAKEELAKLEQESKRIAEEKDEMARLTKINEEEAKRLKKEREQFEIEKNRSVVTKVYESIASSHPVEYLKNGFNSAKSTLDKVVLVGKIGIGAIGTYLAVKVITPVVHMFGEMKNLFKGNNNNLK